MKYHVECFIFLRTRSLCTELAWIVLVDGDCAEGRGGQLVIVWTGK